MRERVALMDPEAIPSTRASGFGFERIPVEFGAVLRSVIHARQTTEDYGPHAHRTWSGESVNWRRSGWLQRVAYGGPKW